MNNFSSFFEFIAALNSAYVVSNHFVESLIFKINRSFNELTTRLKSLKEVHSNNGEQLREESNSCGSECEAVIKELFDKESTLKDRFLALEKDLADSMAKNGVSYNFNYLCLFGALFSLFLLLLIGFEYDFEIPFYRSAFLIFTILSVILIFTLFRTKKGAFQNFIGPPTYKKILWIFPISILLTTLLTYFLHKFNLINCQYNFTWLLKILAILTPGLHFIVYFLKSVTITRVESRRLLNDLQQLWDDSEAYGKELRDRFDTIKKIRKAIP